MRSLILFGGHAVPKFAANLKGRRNRGVDEQQQWATAVVQKAAPKIVKSLIDAAGALGQPAPKFPAKPPTSSSEGGEDESLAALLLRLLRTPETGEDSDAGANARTSVG